MQYKYLLLTNYQCPTNEYHGDFVVKGPLEERVVLPSHDDKEEGEVGPVTHAVSIEVRPHAQLVAVPAEITPINAIPIPT